MRFSAFERGLGAVPIGLGAVQPILQDIVHLGHSVLDQPFPEIGVDPRARHHARAEHWPDVLLEGPDGLYLVDQHVAHERILYERLRRSLAAATPPSQVLLSPLLLDLSPAERLRLLELAPALETCGFGFTVLSGQTLALTAVPAVLSACEAEGLLGALADDFGRPHGHAGLGIRRLRKDLFECRAGLHWRVVFFAEKGVFTAYDVMTHGEIKAWLRNL